MSDLILGIDGGGTSCRAALADATGRILGRGKSGAANILSDPEGTLVHIRAAALAALAEAGLPEERISTLTTVLGLAGNNAGAAVHAVAARLPFADAEIVSDGLIALEGALGPADGAVAILGTGSIFLLRHQGTVQSFGGWGFVIGDFGSGARIGQAALRETLLAHDGIRPESGLTRTMLAAHGDAPGPMVEFARHATPGDFGRHAPEVFAAARAGDPVALDILTEAARSVDACLDRMLALSGPTPLSLLGGLAPLYPDYLAERHRARLVAPLGDAVSGAVALARARLLARRESAA